MPNWLVQLEGDAFDLEALAFFVRSEDLEVQKRDDKFFLKTAALDGLDSDLEVLTRASSLLELINGAASLSIEGHTQVRIHGVVQADANGQLISPVIVGMAVTMAGRSRMLARGTVLHSDGSVEPEPGPEMISWIRLAGQNSEVALAFRLLDEEAGRLVPVV